MKKTENDVALACEFCESACDVCDESSVLCRRRGMVARSYCCRKFRYDPLKRRPMPPLVLAPIDGAELVL